MFRGTLHNYFDQLDGDLRQRQYTQVRITKNHAEVNVFFLSVHTSHSEKFIISGPTIVIGRPEGGAGILLLNSSTFGDLSAAIKLKFKLIFSYYILQFKY